MFWGHSLLSPHIPMPAFHSKFPNQWKMNCLCTEGPLEGIYNAWGLAQMQFQEEGYTSPQRIIFPLKYKWSVWTK